MMDTRRAYAASAPANWLKQRGVAAVEFALIASFLFTLLFGIMEFGRVLFYWNATIEATRLGARLAVVCDKDAAAIKTKMSAMLNILTSDKIDIAYNPSGCTAATCTSVTVSILPGMNVPTFIPFLPLNMIMPPFTTTLPRESMTGPTALPDGSVNPDCS